MNRSDVLRDLYEALEMLDVSQARRASSSSSSADTSVVVDLRDADRGLLARNLGRPEPRVTLGADWERGPTRW